MIIVIVLATIIMVIILLTCIIIFRPLCWGSWMWRGPTTPCSPLGPRPGYSQLISWFIICYWTFYISFLFIISQGTFFMFITPRSPLCPRPGYSRVFLLVLLIRSSRYISQFSSQLEYPKRGIRAWHHPSSNVRFFDSECTWLISTGAHFWLGSFLIGLDSDCTPSKLFAELEMTSGKATPGWPRWRRIRNAPCISLSIISVHRVLSWWLVVAR